MEFHIGDILKLYCKRPKVKIQYRHARVLEVDNGQKIARVELLGLPEHKIYSFKELEELVLAAK